MKLSLSSKVEGDCDIFSLNFNKLNLFFEKLEKEKDSVFFVIDSSLKNFDNYKSLLKNRKIFYFTASEENKNFDIVKEILKFLMENNADRKSFLIAVGGGITLDVAGFVAAIYMRGINFGFVPTTLLAMVDASIGGKNGVNFYNFKNYVGTFSHPSFIAIVPEFLDTLDKREFNVGMAEVIKYGAIAKPDLMDFLILKSEQIKNKDKEALDYLIEQSVKTKVEVVENDFKESGLRKILNFGHTLGHALERLKKVSHGEGVAAGMAFASFISLKKGYLSENEFDKVIKVISQFELPVFIKGVSVEDLMTGIAGDKKKKGNSVDFVLLNGIGNAIVENMALSEIRGYLEDLYKHYGK